jgi:hypothetical protein
MEEFFSSGRRRREDAPAAVAEADTGPDAGQVPTIQGHGDPGWYPDADNPGLMRYWDGFHLTGQVLHVHSRAGDADVQERTQAEFKAAVNQGARATDLPPASDSELASSVESLPLLRQEGGTPVAQPTKLVGSDPKATSAVPESTPDPVAAVSEEAVATTTAAPPVEPVEPVEPVAESKAASEAESGSGPASEPDVASGPEAITEPDVAPKPAVVTEPATGSRPTPASAGALTNKPTEQLESRETGRIGAPPKPKPTLSGDRPIVEVAANEAAKWAQEAERAVAHATSAATPEAWKEAAKVAVVVSEMAQTLQAAVEADQVAARLGQAAREAAEGAHQAAQKSADADRSAQRAQRAADDSDAAAKVARQAAVDAKQLAEQAANALPKFVEVEKASAQVAAEAKRKAQSLEEIVAKASTSDTPAAWSEALSRASTAVSEPVRA